jgi:ABC-type hemin transport system substrate-binding protein
MLLIERRDGTARTPAGHSPRTVPRDEEVAGCPGVVSLLPSTIEIVHALGFGDALVGRSHECDHPPGVDSLPVASCRS